SSSGGWSPKALSSKVCRRGLSAPSSPRLPQSRWSGHSTPAGGNPSQPRGPTSVRGVNKRRCIVTMANAATGQPVDPREGEQFFLNVAEKLDNPFPDLKYFRENRPVFYYAPLNNWFVFRYDDVYALFHDPRLSADRMKGLVDAAPAEVRGELRRITPYLESWML